MSHSTPQQLKIEFPSVKYCECGCGQPAPIAKETDKRCGHVKGQPIRFVNGHNTRRPIVERFWERVDKRGPDDCWLWQATTSSTGYGLLSVNGTYSLAHRVSWELHHGPIPDGFHCLHKCDNPPCCNPNHLFLGTHRDNIDDMNTKGRQAKGVHVAGAKLTPEKIRRIRKLSKDGISQYAIATQFGVTQSNISCIIKGKTWSHVK